MVLKFKNPKQIITAAKCPLDDHSGCLEMRHRSGNKFILDGIVHYIRGHRKLENFPR